MWSPKTLYDASFGTVFNGDLVREKKSGPKAIVFPLLPGWSCFMQGHTSLAFNESLLSPVDRNSEILFGAFMVISYTGAFQFIENAGVDSVFYAALTCNVAWGAVDAIMYLLRELVSRYRTYNLLMTMKSAEATSQIRDCLLEIIPEELHDASLADDKFFLTISPRLKAFKPERPSLTCSDVASAIIIFVIVVLTTFPPILPFLFISDLKNAMRVSEGVCVLIFFLSGWSWASYAGVPHPMLAGVAMALVGILISILIIVLNGG